MIVIDWATVGYCMLNKYIGDDTKAAASQSLNCIKKRKK